MSYNEIAIKALSGAKDMKDFQKNFIKIVKKEGTR